MTKRTQQRLPLTPASSTEITAMDHGGRGGDPADAVAAFALPPAAISTPTDPVLCNDCDHHHHHHDHNKLAVRNSSSSNHQPLSPTSPPILTSQPAAARSRPTATKRSAPELELPPPPTRARKIIQMKPKSQHNKNEHEHEQEKQEKQGHRSPDTMSRPNGGSSSKNNSKAVASSSSSTTTTTTTKKKQNSGTTNATGRKVARKTAHSLIERRRRSKMNEEFGTLKDMIPACRGQDMHKLAILQGGIEYVTYLEQCIDDLKAAANRRKDDSTTPSPKCETGPGSRQDELSQPGQTFCPHCSAAREPLPSQHAQMLGNHQYGPDQRASRESFFPPPPTTTQPSPVGPGGSNELTFPGRPSAEQQMPSCSHQNVPHSACSSTTTSPVVPPQETSSASSFHSAPYLSLRPGADEDHEASAALLMLNKLDSEPRRNAKEPKRKLGISVKDLLSH